jgi:hypothetical protein
LREERWRKGKLYGREAPGTRSRLPPSLPPFLPPYLRCPGEGWGQVLREDGARAEEDEGDGEEEEA